MTEILREGINQDLEAHKIVKSTSKLYMRLNFLLLALWGHLAIFS